MDKKVKFKTIEEANRGIDFNLINDEQKNKLIAQVQSKGFMLDFDNDIVVHPKYGAFVKNIILLKSGNKKEELEELKELISNKYYKFVLGEPYNLTFTGNDFHVVYGLYCGNYKYLLDKEEPKEKTL